MADEEESSWLNKRSAEALWEEVQKKVRRRPPPPARARRPPIPPRRRGSADAGRRSADG